jgi:hypothetical protein
MEDFLKPETRANDIILGSLGFASEGRVIVIERYAEGYRGKARFDDGEELEFDSPGPLDQLEEWAIGVLQQRM